jgi:hypothetical protein
MDTLLRRRAIYTGMRAYFDDVELLRAIRLWQQDYSLKPKFALSVFVARCCNTPELKAQRIKILAAIFIAMDMPENQLLPDPLVDISVADKATLLHDHRLDAKTSVFMQLLTHILLNFNELEARNIKQYLIANLHLIKTDQRRVMHLRDWFSGRTEALAANYDIVIMQKLINQCYVAMCNYAGPIKADQYLAAAIKETEPLSTSLKFRLHDLL